MKKEFRGLGGLCIGDFKTNLASEQIEKICENVVDDIVERYKNNPYKLKRALESSFFASFLVIAKIDCDIEMDKRTEEWFNRNLA